jgi:hypothetical protein
VIASERGEIPVEWLAPGDRVLTRDNGYQPLVGVERTCVPTDHFHLNPEDCPVRVPAGTLASCAPERDLLVSGHHRLLVRALNGRHFAGQSELLTPAHAWADLGLAEAFVPEQTYTFTHLFCAAHQIIHAQGAWVESCMPAPRAVAGPEGDPQRSGMPLLCGATGPMAPARPCLERRAAYAVIDGARDSRFNTLPDTVLKRA